MTWEWVAPAATGVAAVTGVYFTWLTGRQGREQVERMARHTEETAGRARLMQERREAYFAALRVANLDLRRKRYERQDKQAKLAEIERTWPKGERVRMTMDAVIAVEAFGSQRARELLGLWAEAVSDEDEQRMRETYTKMVDLTRHELGTQSHDSLDASGLAGGE